MNPRNRDGVIWFLSVRPFPTRCAYFILLTAASSCSLFIYPRSIVHGSEFIASLSFQYDDVYSSIVRRIFLSFCHQKSLYAFRTTANIRLTALSIYSWRPRTAYVVQFGSYVQHRCIRKWYELVVVIPRRVSTSLDAIPEFDWNLRRSENAYLPSAVV